MVLKKFWLKRLLINSSIIVVFTLLLFILLSSMPGNFFEVQEYASTEQKEALQQFYGAEGNVLNQYFWWLQQFLRGNWGQSYYYNQSVKTVFYQFFRVTFLLQARSFLAAFFFIIFVSLLLAPKKKSSMVNRLAKNLAIILSSLPLIVVALISYYIVARQYFSVALLNQRVAIGILFCNYSAIFFRYLQPIARQIFLSSPVSYARKKKLPLSKILLGWVLKPMLPYTMQLFSIYLPLAVSGSIVIETIFSINGLGFAFYQAILARDQAIVMSYCMIMALIIFLGNFLVDFLIALIDRRIEFD